MTDRILDEADIFAPTRSGPASVPARVAEAIQTMIRDRNLEPGAALPSQRDLAAMLGASRPSVREGVSMLETLGIVRVEIGRGIFVSEPRSIAPGTRFAHSYSLREVYQFRAMLEPAAVSAAAGHLGPEDLAAMRANAEALAAAASDGDRVAAAEQDTLFHGRIFSACDNRLFRDIYVQMRAAMQDSQWAPMVIADSIVDTAREHLAIVEALEKGDGPAASAAMEAHIRLTAERCNVEI
ncbi:putative L-lactate dehydrogenase operon regulatory protein [Hartmannibacter diazotrophicus]|uniref:Putative L-lactate dehydrogenase operon regulatory protein n=1 Tax=Hartmannibacter diazotrophicus TaxID=1482074 RepID=A0A2C9DE96_9HYPH|nr:FadR/GntR family transcriptional regulator [Hartmannibacter diazotrophicus]SON58095.1 putative L-lactate dehydrogenase operon regulatory protein [Hartmannibacter diazotrophicus]